MNNQERWTRLFSLADLARLSCCLRRSATYSPTINKSRLDEGVFWYLWTPEASVSGRGSFSHLAHSAPFINRRRYLPAGRFSSSASKSPVLNKGTPPPQSPFPPLPTTAAYFLSTLLKMELAQDQTGSGNTGERRTGVTLIVPLIKPYLT